MIVKFSTNRMITIQIEDNLDSLRQSLETDASGRRFLKIGDLTAHLSPLDEGEGFTTDQVLTFVLQSIWGVSLNLVASQMFEFMKAKRLNRIRIGGEAVADDPVAIESQLKKLSQNVQQK
jgi:hypothetical protein